MCHNNAVNALPEPASWQDRESNGVIHRHYAAKVAGSDKRLAIITDIYGCNLFYQSFATYFAEQGWNVELIDLFSELGELKEVTREAAFERRHKLRDGEACDRLQRFIAEQEIAAVIGFCLGGNYVFELAKRGVDIKLVTYYPFPAGLQNQDPLETPLDYLAQLNQPVTVLVGDADDSAGRDNIAQLAQITSANASLDVHVYAGSGHGFLTQLDSEDEDLRTNAEQSLAVCVKAISI